MSNKISVVIPVYNRPWELRRALQSLAQQTYRKFEVVVCDDGSTEDVCSVVQEFKFLLQVRYLRIDNSGGPARPRNVAVGAATGEWISFLDSDDWWDNDRMARVVEMLDDSIDLLYHRLRFVKINGRTGRRGLRTSVGSPMHGEPLRYMALHGNPIPNSAAVVRRESLGRIGGLCEDPALVAYEDFDVWLRLVENGARVKFLNRILGSYWLGDDGISVLSKKQIQKQHALFERHVDKFPLEFRAAAMARHNYTIGSMWGRTREKKMSKEYLMLAKGLPSVSLRLLRALKLFSIFISARSN